MARCSVLVDVDSRFSQLEPDPGVIEGAQKQDPCCCEQIFRQFEAPVYNLALRLAQDRDEALDILQETFVVTFKRIHQFRGQAPFWAWLRQIAVRLCLSQLRTQQRRQRKLRALSPPTSCWQGQPEANLDLATALARLAAETRAVLWLYDVEGYSHKEIAALFGRSVSFSKTQVSRAHRKLRAWLEPQRDQAPCDRIVTAL